MNEFSLIDKFFKKQASIHEDVVLGIGDDAACLSIPPSQELLVSTDTLVAEVHFLSSWDPSDIASKAVRVNVSDIAAMAAKPRWLTLALTLPVVHEEWLERFSHGLHKTLKCFNLALIGGDMTKGPLSITLTILGLAPTGKAIRRSGAKPGDKIYVSGEIGAAACALSLLNEDALLPEDKQVLMQKMLHPQPRSDLAEILRDCATAAIDISDGLAADLNHICEASGFGACLNPKSIPIHPLVKKYQTEQAIDFALSGGDDYELCFTVPAENEKRLLAMLAKLGLSCFPIGIIEEKKGLRMINDSGMISSLVPLGYRHF